MAERDAASAANLRADHYMLAVVLFAMALFFAGISRQLRGQLPHELLLVVGGVLLLGTAIRVVTLGLVLRLRHSVGQRVIPSG